MTFSRKVRYPTNLAKYSTYHYLDSNHLYSRFGEEKKMLWKSKPIPFKRLVCVVFTAGIPAFTHTPNYFYLIYCELVFLCCTLVGLYSMSLFICFVVTENSSLCHSSKREWNRLFLQIIIQSSFFKKGG